MKNFLINKNYLIAGTMITKLGVRFLSSSLENNPFFSPIPMEYIRNKQKTISIFFTLDILNLPVFESKLKECIDKDVDYTAYIRVRYDKDSYFMAGNQFGFSYNNDGDIADLYSVFRDKLNEYFADYHLVDEDIVYVELIFRKISTKLLSEFKKTTTNQKVPTDSFITDNDYNKKLLNIPISVDEQYLGKPLDVSIENNTISTISINIKGKSYNFLDIIKSKAKLLRSNHVDYIVSFDQDFKFYLLRDSVDFVLGIKFIDDNTIEKIRYSINGVIISRVIDTRDKNMVKRISKSDNKEMVFLNKEVISVKKGITLKAIEKPRIKSTTLFVSNPNIGVIDTETFTATDGTQKIYALGFKTNLADKPVIYYINKDNLDSNKIVLDMVNELLRPKYNKTSFYCHNLSGYDVVFILKILCIHNESSIDKYDISTILRKDRVIEIKISKNNHSFIIKDSYAMLPQSLERLGSNYEVETLKSYFPYKFGIQENLFYVGQTPDKSYYNNISTVDYSDLYQKEWSFKDETIKYLNNDLNSLHQVLSKVNRQVFEDYGVNITDNITISGLALRIFLKDYYKGNIPAIIKYSIYNDIKQAYYGGITEVYKPCGYNLYYYDVNSLYPYVSLQDMPGIDCNKITYNTEKSIGDLFGFFRCSIEAPLDNYLGLLPVRDESGINFPVGKWVGWYFSEELKFAEENGYTINVLEGYNFNRQADVFKEYIDKVYSIKSTTKNNTQKSIAKSLLNNLLGRFGISLDKPITELMDEESFERISTMHKVTSYKKISKDNLLVSYVPKLDNDIIKSHGLDFLKILNKHSDKEVQSLNVSSVAISAAITAYGRIHITKLKLDILKNGGILYYSDTDSIITDKKLDDSLVSHNEIGKLKLEHNIDKGIFISGKTYWFCNDKGEFVNKAKGIKSTSLSYFDYVKLLNNNNIYTAIKSESKIDWELGHVKIGEKLVNINSTSYTKRDKVYQKGEWINTKPVVIAKDFTDKVDLDIINHKK